MSVRGQPVGDHHAMAFEIDTFCAHVGAGRFLREADELSDPVLEFFREHVVGIISEAGTSQRHVGRIVANLVAAASKLFHP